MTGGIVQVILAACAFAIGVLASAAFSGLETGAYVLNKIRLELRVAHGDRSAARLSRALARPQEMLGALLMGTNACHYVVTAMAVVVLTRAGSPSPQFYTTVILAPLLFVLGEMLPKNLFRLAGETLTYRLGWFITGTMAVCRWTGLSQLVSALSRAVLYLTPARNAHDRRSLEPSQRIRSFLSEGYAHGVISGVQSQMAERVVGLGAMKVRDVMIPAHNVVSVARSCPRDRFMEVLAGHNFSRLAVWGEQPSDIVGIVNVFDVLYDSDPAAGPARHMIPPVDLNTDMTVAEGLLTLQRERRSMGIVRDKAGRFVGVATIKDLVEEIVGELEAW